jgi:hypothetical protein
MPALTKRLIVILIIFLESSAVAFADPWKLPWGNYGNSPQHTAISRVKSQPLKRILWHASMDRNPQYSGNDLFIHYGSPLVTSENKLIMPVKTGATDDFEVEVRNGADGTLLYTLATDYSLPPHGWTPSFGPTLTVNNRLYWAGAGGTVYYSDNPDSPIAVTGQIAFYGNARYEAAKAQYDAGIKIATPLVGDGNGNIYFGYVSLGATPLNLKSGIAKISPDGKGSYITAEKAARDDVSISQVLINSAPALSNDQETLYFAVSNGNYLGAGYLVSVKSSTLAPIARIRLKDPASGMDANLLEDGSASTMVGPDGDVYFGVLENPFLSHNDRGWLLHFDGALTQTKTPGSFGWDDTASVVDAQLVPSYHGTSAYLLLTKYNNYAPYGDGINKLAILDPNAPGVDPINHSTTVMNEIITVTGPTRDLNAGPSFPKAVREWCINSAVIDPFTKSALVNNEDGKLYRWDFKSNTLIEKLTLTRGIGEAYTPTLVGVDGTVYAINNATLFAVGQRKH